MPFTLYLILGLSFLVQSTSIFAFHHLHLSTKLLERSPAQRRGRRSTTLSLDKPLLAEGINIRILPAGVPPTLQQGQILVAKPWEYNHFTSKSCLFLYKHDSETGSRGVVLEKPTAFTLSELAPPFAASVFANHTVFLGGEQGGDMAVLLHPYKHVPGVRSVGGGLYYGGLSGAEAMFKEQEENKAEHGLDRSQFKWWFNYMSWGPGQLEDQVLKGSWDVMEGEGGEGEGAARAVLRQGLALDRELWRTLRRHYLPRERGYDADGDEE